MGNRAHTQRATRRLLVVAGGLLGAILIAVALAGKPRGSEPAVVSPAGAAPEAGPREEPRLASAAALPRRALTSAAGPSPGAQNEALFEPASPGEEWRGLVLAGRVSCEASGAALVARLRVRRGEQELHDSASTPDGSFELRLGRRAADGLVLIAETPGYAPRALDLDGDALARPAPWPGALALAPSGSWRLRVADEDGRAVFDAEVWALTPSPRSTSFELNLLQWSEAGRPRLLGRTDNEGWLELPGGAHPALLVTSGETSALVAAPPTPGTLVARLSSGVRVHLVDAAGSPAAGVELLVGSSSSSLAGRRTSSVVRTDERGRLPWRLPLESTTSIRLPGHLLGVGESGDHPNVVHWHHARESGDFTLSVGPVLPEWRLLVRAAEDGEALERFEVWIEEGRKAAWETHVHGARRSTVIEVEGNEIDLWTLIARGEQPMVAIGAPGRRIERVDFAKLEAAGDHVVRLRRAPEGYLQLLTHAGAPWREPVTLWQLPAHRPLLSDRPGPDGLFGPFPVDGDELVLREGDGFWGREVGRRRLGWLRRFGGTVEVRLAPRTASLTVLPPAGEASVPEEPALFLVDEGGQWRAGRRVDGRLLFEALNPGRYALGPRGLLAAANRREPEAFGLTLLPDQAIEVPFDAEWMLPATRTLLVRVPHGPPPSGLTLEVGDGRSPYLAPSDFAEDWATFELGPNWAGETRVALRHQEPGHLFEFRPRRLLAGRLGGEARSEWHLAAGRVRLEVSAPESPEAQAPTVERSARLVAGWTDAHGTSNGVGWTRDEPGLWDLGWLPAGHIELSITGFPNGAPLMERQVHLLPGQTLQLPIELHFSNL